MITEDYVSFEVAKLLKEKGFDEQCMFMYDSQHKLYSTLEQCRQVTRNNSDWVHFVGELNICPIAVPTLQMAMKWLREVHNIFIDISIIYIGGSDKLTYLWLPCVIKEGHIDYPTMEEYMADSYEQACEAAIKYCLTNLI